MWSLRKKNKTNEEVIKDMKAKAEQIEKLKNEVNEMGKLILVDGKLQKKEDTPKQIAAPLQPTQEEVMSARIEQETQQYQQQMSQRPMPQMPRPILQPQGPTREEYEYMLEQQAQQQTQQQAFMQQQRQPQVQQQLLIAIELVHGNIVQIVVPMDKFESFVQEVNTAIDNQCAIPIGNKIINGAQIAMYYVVDRDQQ